MIETLWILDTAGVPVEAPDAKTWGRWRKENERGSVGRTEAGGIFVSTEFIGVDDQWWETMVFWPGDQQIVARYRTRDDARSGHQAIVERVHRGELTPEPDHA
jgi:hypothetical protein